MPDFPILVTGATGQQGGATARALLAKNVPVRALVRDPSSAKAQEIQALGAELVAGNLLDRDSVRAAVQGVRAVFSVQMPALTDGKFDYANELAQAFALIDEAAAARVPHFVQTTSTGTGLQNTWPGWSEGRWAPQEAHYDTKTSIQQRLRAAGFASWTLIKPGTFMENFRPETAYLMPRGIEGGIVTVLKPHTRLSLVAVQDVGTAAAAALTDPQRFDRVELELAGDFLPMSEIAAILSRALGTPLAAPDLNVEQALAAGMPAYAAVPHEMLNVVGQSARPEFARGFGLELTSFEQWTRQNLQLVSEEPLASTG